MIPKESLSANDPPAALITTDGDLASNYHTLDDTIPNSGSGLYALKKIGVGFENQARASSIDRSKMFKKESSIGDFSSLSLVNKVR